MQWSDWDPASYPGSTRIQFALDEMPASPIKTIPKIISLIENPDSRFYLVGPTTIKAHDLVHVMLGRGLLSQDEAFVIGFTMGDASGAAAVDRLIFLNFSRVLYPKPFKFTDRDENVYNFAFDCGLAFRKKDIHRMDADALANMTIDEARKNYRIEEALLREWYRYETSMIPDTKSSRRLKKNFALGD